MAWWTTLGMAGGTAAGGAAVAVVGVAAVVGYVFVLPQFQADDPAPIEIARPAPQQDVAPAPAEPAAPVVAATPPPIFDVVRIDAKGAALIAGIAPAGVDVDVLLDGVAINRSTTGGDGRFVALFDVPPSELPRSLQLAALVMDKAPLLSEQTVLVAPFGAVTPEAVADVAPELPSSSTSGSTSSITAPEVAPAPVIAPAAPALVIADADGVRPLQPARAPAAPTLQPRSNVIIDTISYNATGAVELAGRGSAEAFVRVYLNNAAVDDSTIDPEGVWATVLADVAPGIYTLRVDELDQTGAVTSRFETPFKREDPQLLAQISGALSPAEPVIATPVEDAPLAGISQNVPSAPAALETPQIDEDTTTLIASAAAPVAPVPSAPATPTAPVADVTEDPVPTTPPASVITVQPGFTLWQIARERFGEGELYVQVFEANRDQIKDPNRIFPGQVFSMPALKDE